MRQVQIRTQVRNVDRSKVPAVVKWETKVSYGVFHDFAMESSDLGGKLEIFPVALVEDKSGHIHSIPIDQITFINPSDYQTCEKTK